MRVLHIITGLGVGGAESMLERLLSDLDPALVSNHVIALKEGGPIAAQIAARGVPVEIIGLNNYFSRGLMPLRVARHIQRIAPDLIQTWLYHADLIGGVAARLARPFGPPIPVAWGVRQSVVNRSLLKPSTWRVIRYAAIASHLIPQTIVVNARASIASHAGLGFDTGKFLLIPNGFDSCRFRPDPLARAYFRKQLDVAPDSILIGLAGRLDPHKDYANFINAARIISAQRQNIVFTACGDGVEPGNPQMAQLLRRYGQDARLRLLGRQTDMPGFWSALDIAVSASVGEGFSNSIGEAMSCALPCIVTDVGDSASLIGDSGKVIPPGQPQALIDAILSMADMPGELRMELGRRARARIETCYSMHAATEGFLNLWKSMLNHTRHTSKQTEE